MMTVVIIAVKHFVMIVEIVECVCVNTECFVMKGAKAEAQANRVESLGKSSFFF
jgi:hypothetical protein